MEEAKAVHKPETIPAPAKAMNCSCEGSSSRPLRASLPKIIVVQQTKVPAKAVHKPDIKLTEKAIAEGSFENICPKTVANLPIIKNKGAPGGWTTWSL